MCVQYSCPNKKQYNNTANVNRLRCVFSAVLYRYNIYIYVIYRYYIHYTLLTIYTIYVYIYFLLLLFDECNIKPLEESTRQNAPGDAPRGGGAAGTWLNNTTQMSLFRGIFFLFAFCCIMCGIFLISRSCEIDASVAHVLLRD